jgi:hypothetical protein
VAAEEGFLGKGTVTFRSSVGLAKGTNLGWKALAWVPGSRKFTPCTGWLPYFFLPSPSLVHLGSTAP